MTRVMHVFECIPAEIFELHSGKLLIFLYTNFDNLQMVSSQQTRVLHKCVILRRMVAYLSLAEPHI